MSASATPQTAKEHDEENERAQLTRLPAELRNMIWRYAIIETSPITFQRSGLHEPALCLVSKQIRLEALPIFYAESTFKISIIDFDIAPHMRWFTMASAARRRGEIGVTPEAAHTMHSFPHWRNLLTWLSLFQDGSANWKVGNLRTSAGGSVEIAVVGAMFSTVDTLQMLPWEVVSKVLNEQRVVLGRVDERWNPKW